MLTTKLFSRAVRGGLLGGIAAVLMTAPVSAGMKDEPADEGRKLELSANVALTSDYVFRGYSQSGEHAAIQGGFDATYGMLYAGVWASSLDFGGAPTNCGAAGSTGDCADIELDLYAGITPSLGPVNLDLGVIAYFYPDANDTGAELDFVEFKAGASVKPIDMVTLGGTVYYSPEYTLEVGEAWTLEGNVEVELPKLGPITPSFSALIGTVIGEDGSGLGNTDDEYVYWNVGMAFAYDKFSLDLRYWDTDVSNAGGFCTGSIFQCDARFAATISASF